MGDVLLHRLLFDLLDEELSNWPSPRVEALLREVGATKEQASALRIRAVQKQGECLAVWSRGEPAND